MRDRVTTDFPDTATSVSIRAPGGCRLVWHLLNSRAGAVSADPDDPDHFVRWSNTRGLPARPHDFLGRSAYGDYPAEVFTQAAARWETTAVPELRSQARRFALDLAAGVRNAALPDAA